MSIHTFSAQCFGSSAEWSQNILMAIDPVRHDLTMLQEPKRSRMSGVGAKSTINPESAIVLMVVNRRRIDPPPIVELRAFDRLGRPVPDNYLMSVSFYAYVTLVHHNTLEPVEGIPYKDNICSPLIGDRVVFLQKAPWLDEHTGKKSTRWVFAMGDLSVRREGWYRLRVDVFEFANGFSHHRGQIHTHPFYTYSPKDFPGMGDATETTSQVKMSGIRLRAKRNHHVTGRIKRRAPSGKAPIVTSIPDEMNVDDEVHTAADTDRRIHEDLYTFYEEGMRYPATPIAGPSGHRGQRPCFTLPVPHHALPSRMEYFQNIEMPDVDRSSSLEPLDRYYKHPSASASPVTPGVFPTHRSSWAPGSYYPHEQPSWQRGHSLPSIRNLPFEGNSHESVQQP